MAHTATHALMRPDRAALRYRGETTTWAQLSRRSLQIAAGLAARGVGEGDRVALLTLNHPWFVETVFGANSLGAMAVPLNFRLAPPELDYILGDSTPSAIFVDAPLVPLLAATPNAANIAAVVVIGEAELQGDQVAYEDFVAAQEPIELPDVSEESTALLMYTSGTTGSPKGVMLSHRNMQVQALTCIRAMEMFDESDIGFLTAPFFHIAGLGSIVANIVLGGTVVIHPLGAFDPAAVLDAYEAEGATVVFNVPQQWDLICAQPDIDKRDLKLRIIRGRGTGQRQDAAGDGRGLPAGTQRGGLRPDRDLPDHLRAAGRGLPPQAGVGRAAHPHHPVPHRRRRHERRAGRRGGRDRLPRTDGHAGLLEQAGGDRGGLRRRLVPLR